MAKQPKAGGKSPAIKAAEAALRKAQAALARARAEDGQGAPEDDEDEVDAEDDEHEIAPNAEGEDDEDADPAAEADDVDDAEESAPAAAIAASAEARSHPVLALAAIQTGQTLAQFKASVAAAGGVNGGRNQLASTLAGSPRLSADGPATKAAARSAADTWKANRAAGLKR